MKSPSSPWLRSAFAMAVLIMGLASCSHFGGSEGVVLRPAPSPKESACCKTAEIYPKWLVRIADPAAPVIGRAIALVEWRRGYLSRQPEVVASLERQLRPLDIVIVSNKGRLSGHTIPGLFAHGAVYLGKERNLKSYGLLGRPSVAAHLAEIRAGKSIIEAEESGVHLSPPDRVLGSDRVVVLRPRLGCKDARRKTLEGFFDHLHTRFDFKFNSAEADRLYCVELIDHVLAGIRFPTRRLYGRDIVMPDEILLRAARGQLPLDVVTYVRASKRGWEIEDRHALIADIEAYWNK